MTSLFRRSALLIGLLFLIGCDETANQPATLRRLDALQAQVQSANATVTNLTGYIQELDKRTAKLEMDISNIQSHAAGSYTAIDLSSTSGFIPISGSCGAFLVSVKNVEPYLEGYRITFKLGNPHFATFSNLRIRAVWGKQFDQALANSDPKYVETYNAALKRKDFNQADELKPGAWNEIIIVLSPAKQSELGYFAVSLDAENVSLATPRN